jgi:hypothetical protein
MKLKVFIGSIMAAALLGVGVLLGSVAGTAQVSAQTPSATATPNAAQTPNAQKTPGTGDRQGGKPFGGGMHRGGRGGHGEFGGGPGFGFGREATADTATRAISSTTGLITLVKGDLAFANGKMDTASAQRWVSGADSLLGKAQSANGASNFEQAMAYAKAASIAASTAYTSMAQKLGADQLPSYSQRPARGDRGMGPGGIGKGLGAANNATITQAQASRLLAATYQRIVGVGAVVAGTADAGTWLTDAQAAYKAAYDAYQAGNYADAAASARIANELAEVATGVQRATTSPGTSGAPVTVPAPNFR